MARTRSLSNLLTDVADRCDVPAFTASTFVSATTMTRWINQSIRRFGQKLIDAYGSEYFAKSANISVVAGTNTYALPTDYYQTIYLRVTLDGDVYGIHHAELDDLIDDGLATGWSSARRPRFRMQGGYLTFTPIPQASHTVQHMYVPTLLVTNSGGTAQAELSASSDLLDGYNGWEEWVVLDCCRKHRVAEEQDETQFLREMAEIDQEIKAAAQKRDREPRRARDTYRRGRA